MLLRYKNRAVRDLAWAIASPALLKPGPATCFWYGDEWYRGLFEASKKRLEQLDREPTSLLQRLAQQKDRRLGNYFETLWAFWLDESPDFEIIEHNMQISDGGRTIGELDFVVLDKITGKFHHWELAIKFYLGVGDTCNQANWHGPGKRDRLDIKVDHLTSRQSLLSQQPIVNELLRAKGIEIDSCGVILKGRLFYPHRAGANIRLPANANPDHLHSHWIDRDHFMELGSDDDTYLAMLKSGWMSNIDGFDGEKLYSRADLMAAVDRGDFRLPLLVVRMAAGVESGRIFVVPNGWEYDLEQENP